MHFGDALHQFAETGDVIGGLQKLAMSIAARNSSESPNASAIFCS